MSLHRHGGAPPTETRMSMIGAGTPRTGPRHRRPPEDLRFGRVLRHPAVAGSWLSISLWSAVTLLSEAALLSYLHGWPS